MANNQFLGRLLTLQQDGSGAISAPSNWLGEAPVLHVSTPAIAFARDFAKASLASSASLLQWRFLVGGPGNGKSMAIRELVLALLGEGAQIHDLDDVALSEITVGRVPSVLQVTLNGVVFALIAQDASVVTDPFSSDPNPAGELLSLLANALEQGCHLIACTNRGVLEEAAKKSMNQSGPVASLLDKLVSVGVGTAESSLNITVDGKGTVQIALSAIAIDSGSLFQGPVSPMGRLLDQATSDANWSACTSCAEQGLCPFNSNRAALRDPLIRDSVLRILEDAELIDGQPLVFREAAAVISLFLAGCAADYQNSSPCEWVAQGVKRREWFVLSTRRLHMLLGSPNAPFGIDALETDQARQLQSLCERAGIEFSRIFGEVSTSLGIPRLFGAAGALNSLDPLRWALPKQISADGWDTHFADGLYCGKLEEACAALWDELDLAFEDDWPEAGECMAALIRWRTAHTVRAGLIATGAHAWRQELDAFRQAIAVPASPTLHQRNEISGLISKILDSNGDFVRIGPHLRLKGNGLVVDVDWDASKNSRRIVLRIGAQLDGSTTTLSANAFSWLHRRQEGPLDKATFPAVWLEAARDAISRAASASCYSKMPSGELEIETPQGKAIRLLWSQEVVEAHYVEEL